MVLLLTFLAFLGFGLMPAALASPPSSGHELTSGYTTVVDEAGQIVLQTGLAVHPGDEYIGLGARLYEVTAVEGTLAKARYMRNEAPSAPAVPPVAAGRQLIAVYYTHEDESYIPSDGQASIPGNGGIFKVGGAFAGRLTELGYQVENDQTRHAPHDANAYQRSRRTVRRLLEQKPAALFDLHRDSAPAAAYETRIGDQPAAKLLLVVGRQNPNRQTSLDYAKRILAAADSRYPGLVRGIFLARGSYNQDLNPQAMLVEVGSQHSSREAAERSAALLADLVPLFLAAPAAGTAGPIAPVADFAGRTASYGRDIAAILGLLAAGIAGFLFLSTGSWQEAKRKLARFRRFEFINFLGPRRKNKK
jgi:stage II sporulation protein P